MVNASLILLSTCLCGIVTANLYRGSQYQQSQHYLQQNNNDRCRYHNCGPYSKCVDKNGELSCVCNNGFIKLGKICSIQKCKAPQLGDDYGYSTSGYQSTYYAGEKMFFVCKPGYELQGKAYATCLRGGLWDNPIPICVRRNRDLYSPGSPGIFGYSGAACYKPILTPNCYYTPEHQSTWYPGQKINFHCEHGYELRGHAYSTCSRTGIWDYPAPTCYRQHSSLYSPGYSSGYSGVKCYKPKLSPNCYYTPKYQSSWNLGQKIHYHCQQGYTLSGNPYSTCSLGGKWDNPAPTCEYIDLSDRRQYCKAPSIPSSCNCELSSSYKLFYKFGDIAKFDCPYGYELKGFPLSTCMYGGYWSHPAPVCVRTTNKKFDYTLELLRNYG